MCLQCLLMPNKKRIKVAAVLIEDDEVAYASVGENVRMKILGCEEDSLSSGCVLCPLDNPTPVATKIRAIVKVMELLEHRPLLTAGYTCVMHVHTAREEVMLGKILGEKRSRNAPRRSERPLPRCGKSRCLPTQRLPKTKRKRRTLSS